MDDQIRAILSEMADMLERGGERYEQLASTSVRAALSGSQQTFDAFLISNELWGGAGSIPDSAFVSDQTRLARFEDLMIRLGRLQIETGRTNVRTESWVRAFESWRDSDLRKPSHEFRFLQGISYAMLVRFLIAATLLPGYLAVRTPYLLRDLRRHPAIALAILAAYVLLIFSGYATSTEKRVRQRPDADPRGR